MKTALLMSILTVLLMVMGYIVGILLSVHPFYVVAVAFAVAVVLSVAFYQYADKIVLKMFGANIVSESIAPEPYSMIFRLSKKAGIPMPRIAIINSEAPNAFAVGRNPEIAVIAVTSGALSLLRREELEAVLAHELGHIKNSDMFMSTLIAAIVGAVGPALLLWSGRSRKELGYTQLLQAVLLFIFVPLAVFLIRAAVSPSREYAADAVGAAISGNPHALGNALIRIEDSIRENPSTQGSPATAHLFIINPFRTRRLVHLLRTHPSTESRVQRLTEMAENQ
ncbi:MAG: hypothetical protein AYK18_04095 [Theionarchaea archaeon DG-70]|nr:MAG: hypothetical protein AYK18_04095 [Theionarchaea archaeon DG-70]